MSFTDYYKILGVPPDASEEEIKGAYRYLAKFYHPDVNKAPEAVKHFIEVQKAYETLIDPIQRKEYDDRNRKEFKRDFQSTSATVPVEHRPGQDSPQVSNPFPSGALSDQAPTPLDDSPYEETHVPYFPRPSEGPPQPTCQQQIPLHRHRGREYQGPGHTS
jgi:curved DNA-binding protein CbpA